MNAAIFEDARNNFKVKSSLDVLIAGAYSLIYKVKYASYPSVIKVQTVPFVVRIIDPCDKPVSVTPAVLTG